MDENRVVQVVMLAYLHAVHGQQLVDVGQRREDESAAEAEIRAVEKPGVNVKVVAETHVAEEPAEHVEIELAEAGIRAVENPGVNVKVVVETPAGEELVEAEIHVVENPGVDVQVIENWAYYQVSLAHTELPPLVACRVPSEHFHAVDLETHQTMS